MTTLDHALDTVMELVPEQREMLIDIVQKRQIELRREEILENARQAMADFRAGKLKPQPVDEIIKELDQCLDEEDE
jgi:hypothetical protein